jgi:hypothetical protein
MNRLYLFLTLIVMLVTGCGGGAALGSKSPSGYGPSYSSSRSGPADYEPSAGSMSSPPSPTMTAPSGGQEARQEAAPQNRPGLGTEFGESRSSRVHDVTFVRADADRPFAIATLHYTDRQGILALARYHENQTPGFREVASGGGAITVSVRDEYGNPLEGFHVGDRNYVVGSQGQRYSIAITNHTGHRFEVVGTVDGLDVVNGRDGSLENRGYVLMPYATLDIEGFRQSHESVAAFRFASVRDSYAAQTGSARNVGVIGVAFFAESGDTFAPYTDDELRTRDTAIPFPGTDARFAQPPPGR